MARITLENITKKFGKVTALDDVSLDIKDKEFFVLFGPAGAGKTTILNCIAGIQLPEEAGDEVVVLVSGLGATPVMELYVLYDEIDRLLTEKGIKTHKAYVGNYFTSLEMMGATLTIMKLDDELKELIDMPAYSMGLKQE